MKGYIYNPDREYTEKILMEFIKKMGIALAD